MRSVPAALVGLLFVTTPFPAHASDQLGLSVDGRTWSSQVTQPLFDSSYAWVPGDEQTRSILVRNQGPSAATLEIALGVGSQDHLVRVEDVLVHTKVGSGDWARLDGSRSIVVPAPLARNGLTTVEIRAVFDPASTNLSQSARARFDLRATLYGDRGPGTDSTSPERAGPPTIGPVDAGTAVPMLPDAGTQVRSWYLWLAAALIGSSAALVLRRDRTKEKARHGNV